MSSFWYVDVRNFWTPSLCKLYPSRNSEKNHQRLGKTCNSKNTNDPKEYTLVYTQTKNELEKKSSKIAVHFQTNYILPLLDCHFLHSTFTSKHGRRKNQMTHILSLWWHPTYKEMYIYTKKNVKYPMFICNDQKPVQKRKRKVYAQNSWMPGKIITLAMQK